MSTINHIEKDFIHDWFQSRGALSKDNKIEVTKDEILEFARTFRNKFQNSPETVRRYQMRLRRESFVRKYNIRPGTPITFGLLELAMKEIGYSEKSRLDQIGYALETASKRVFITGNNG